MIEGLFKHIHVDMESGCWIWTGTKTKGKDGGYGQASVNGQRFYAHRLFYEYYNCWIPDGMVIDHICRVRSCVNPSHLRAVTVRQNALENNNGPAAINSAKTRCIHGHNNWAKSWSGNRKCKDCERVNQKAKRKREREARSKSLM